jgi:two-component system autoinducer 2 sensor kinase/phosphatase LuxQ
MNPDNIDAPFYSLIFMDWQMPVMDGLEATEKLRQMLKLDVPIVALTANAAPQHRDDALAAGANEFATKPILREKLFETCRRYLCDDCKKLTHQD